MRQHHRLHIVENVDSGAATKEAQGAFHAAKKRAHGLAEREFQVERARVAHHHHEGADPARAARQCEAEVGPIHLRRRAWLEVQCEERLLLGVRAQLPKPLAHDGDATAIAEGAQALQHRWRTHLWRVAQDLPDGPVVGQEQTRARCHCALDGAIAIEHLAYCLARDLEPTGDGADTKIFGVGQTEHLGSPLGEQIFVSAHGLHPGRACCARCDSAD